MERGPRQRRRSATLIPSALVPSRHASKQGSGLRRRARWWMGVCLRASPPLSRAPTRAEALRIRGDRESKSRVEGVLRASTSAAPPGDAGPASASTTAPGDDAAARSEPRGATGGPRQMLDKRRPPFLSRVVWPSTGARPMGENAGTDGKPDTAIAQSKMAATKRRAPAISLVCRRPCTDSPKPWIMLLYIQ